MRQSDESDESDVPEATFLHWHINMIINNDNLEKIFHNYSQMYALRRSKNLLYWLKESFSWRYVTSIVMQKI
jgi:hypothetical protein